jgi:hypothetical protein
MCIGVITFRIGFYLYSLVMLGVSTLKYEYTPDRKKKNVITPIHI